MSENRHIVVGPGRQCLCGDYGRGPMFCGDVISYMQGVVQSNPNGHPDLEFDLCLALSSLIQDCSDPKPQAK